MFRTYFIAKKVAHLTHISDFEREMEFSIPEKSELVLAEGQQERLGIRRHGIEHFHLAGGDSDCNRQVFRMKGGKESVCELYSILEKSGFTVAYTANGSHQIANDIDLLISLILKEKGCLDQLERKFSYYQCP